MTAAAVFLAFYDSPLGSTLLQRLVRRFTRRVILNRSLARDARRNRPAQDVRSKAGPGSPRRKFFVGRTCAGKVDIIRRAAWFVRTVDVGGP